MPVLSNEQLASIWAVLAIPRDHPFIHHFRGLAGELDMAIALTYLEDWDPLPRNSMSLIDRHGEIVMTYAKVHTCDFSVNECSLTPGDGFYVCPLDTAQSEVKIGAMICYDREFPESARVLMLKGAEIILTPNACPLNRIRLDQFCARTYENQLDVAMTNYALQRYVEKYPGGFMTISAHVAHARPIYDNNHGCPDGGSCEPVSSGP